MISNLKKIIAISSLFLLSFYNCFSQDSQNMDQITDSLSNNINTYSKRENVIAQMNYCITSLTNIIHNKSISVLNHESDQILNNLTIEHIVGLPEINDFRIDLLDAVSKFSITEQERDLLKRIQSIKRDNMKWAALSNALDPTMLITGNAGIGMGYQLAFQTLLTAARSVVEYQTMQNEQDIEELKAMWDLRKLDLENISNIRKEALRLTYRLFEKYHLSENERLTEATANDFSLYISDPDAAKRARLLEANGATYKHIAEYYYHLGMAYCDLNNYSKAKCYFEKYLEMYKRTPLLRYDEKSGCIALFMLANEKILSPEQKENLIDTALNNLPHNSAAILQCALVYLYELSDYEKAFKLIRDGIEDPNASDRPLLFMAAAKMLPLTNSYPQLKSEICSLFNENSELTLDSYITYMINGVDDVWSGFNSLIKFENISISGVKQLFNNKLQMVLPEKMVYDTSDILVFLEQHDENKITVTQLQPSYANGVDIEDIEDVNCFKYNKDLKYLYFNVLEPEKCLIVKQDLDYTKISTGEWHRQSEFNLSDNDIEEIIDFCKDNTPKDYLTRVDFKKSRSCCEIKQVGNVEMKISRDSTKLNNIKFQPRKDGYYIRVVLNNDIYIMYKYENKLLVPYLYKCPTGVYYNGPEVKRETPSWLKSTTTFIKDYFAGKSENEK